jgi:hypothetical protein
MPRPAFKATEQQRQLTQSMAAYGIPQESIAKVIGVRSPKTLRKHFRRELDLSAIEANTRVAQTAYRLATSGKSVCATMFWLRCRAGWKETGQGPDQGGPEEDKSHRAEKREVSRIVWRTTELPPEGDNDPPAAAPTSDSSTSNEGEEQEAGPETGLATQDLEAPDTQQLPTETTLQAPRAKEPDDALD